MEEVLRGISGGAFFVLEEEDEVLLDLELLVDMDSGPP